MVLLALLFALAGCGAPPPEVDEALASTYTGAPWNYAGEGVLLVVTWTDWASVWPLLREEVETFRASAPENVDFQFVHVDDHRELVRRLGAQIVPSVVIIRDGRVVEILPNVSTAGQLDQAAQKWLGS